MRALLAPALLLLSAACATPATEVMVEIDAEPAIRAETDRIALRVLGGAAGTPPSTWALRLQTTFAEPRWPRRVALVPIEAETARVYRVEVRAERADGSVVTSSALRGGYVRERKKVLRLLLEDACLDVECGEMRCQGGRCVDPLVDVGTAPDLLADGGR